MNGEDRASALEQFKNIAACDDETAQEMLAQSNWNLEAAVANLFDDPASIRQDEEPEPVEEAYVERQPLMMDDSQQSTGRDNKRRPSGYSPANVGFGSARRLLRTPLQLLALPFTLILYALSSAISLIARLFGVRPNLPSFSLRFPSAQHTRVLDPRQAAEHFVRDLEEETGNTATYSVASGVQIGPSSMASTSTSSPSRRSLPNFHIGSYESALSLAKEQMKPLLVVLISSEHDDAAAFKKETLCDTDLLTTLENKNFITWGGDVKYKDAYQTSQILEATTFPFLAFITLQPPRSTPGSPSPGSTPKMTLFSRLEGSPLTHTSATSILTHINTVFLPRTSAYLERQKKEKRNREMERQYKADQDRAYAEAGRKDVERIRAKEASMRAEKEEAARKEKEEKEKLSLEEQKRAWRKWAKAHLVPVEGEGSRLSVKLPDGRRLQGKFGKDVRMEQIYAWIDTQAYEPDLDNGGARPAGYEHAYGFTVVCMFPKRGLPFGEAKDMSLESAGLVPSASLLVEGMILSAGDSSEEEASDEE